MRAATLNNAALAVIPWFWLPLRFEYTMAEGANAAAHYPYECNEGERLFAQGL